MKPAKTLLGVLLITLMITSFARAEVKKSIAVAPTQWQAAATVSWITGEAITAQMITELEKSGRYRVVERENIKGILDEQDMGTAGRVRGGSGPKTGDIEGAQLMIKFVITDAEEESGKGGKIGIGGIGIGGSKTTYRITADVRIYDMQTSLILGTTSVTAEQKKKKKGGGIGIGGIGASGNKSGGDTTGAITRSLIKQALAALDKESKVLGWKSTILKYADGKVILRGGSRDGLEPGMKFDVFELGEQLVDEDTGEVLDEGEETQIGKIEITKVKDKVCYAKIIDGKEPAKGNVVRLIEG